MTDTSRVSRGPGRSNVRGALITLLLEAAVVAMLTLVGVGISFLVLLLTG